MSMKKFQDGVPWESIVGYSRAVQVGQQVHLSGTTALNQQGELVGKGNAFLQCKQVIENIQRALEHFELGLENVYRTRLYVVNIADWEEVGRAHGEFFSHIQPTCTMVEVSALIDPDMLIEIEAEAWVPSPT